MPALRGDLRLPPLPDYLRPGLLVVFIGFNPGERSARTGHYYGHPGNRFWWLLHRAGFTDRLLHPGEDATLSELGYGLTDLVDRPSRSSADLEGWELKDGRAALLRKLQTCRPRFSCYNGRGIYQALTGRRDFAYGEQLEPVVPGVRDFVAASPSGRSREPLARKLQLYAELRALLNGLPAACVNSR